MPLHAAMACRSIDGRFLAFASEPALYAFPDAASFTTTYDAYFATEFLVSRDGSNQKRLESIDAFDILAAA